MNSSPSPHSGGAWRPTAGDPTAERRVLDSHSREREFARAALASMGDAVVTTNLLGQVASLNPAAERLSGWRVSEAIGRSLDEVLRLVSDVTREPVESPAVRCLREGRVIDMPEDVLLLRPDGTEIAIEDSAAPIIDRHGMIAGVVIVFHDVSERRRMSRVLTHQATHDALTGLHNRAEFERHLSQVLREAGSKPGDAMAHVLCYLDLDRFKAVNDTSGHEAGDMLLKAISRGFRARLRRSDRLARLGGDEFGVLLADCDVGEAEEIAEALRMAVQELRFEWGEQHFTLSVSIGLVPIALASTQPQEALRAADAACYAAKANGGNWVHVGEIPTDGVTVEV